MAPRVVRPRCTRFSPIHRLLRQSLAGLAAWAVLAPALAQTQVEYVHPVPAQQQSRQTLSASVVAADSADLSPAVAGLVAQVTVEAGDFVAAGDELLRLDTELAELALRQAIAATRAVEIQLQEARRLRDEGETLARRGDLSRSLQDARVAEQQRLSAELQRLQAVQAERQALLARHRLRAPFGGTVVARLTAPGEWINPGTPVLRLISGESAQVHVRLAQSLQQQMAEGDAAQIHLPGQQPPVAARVVRISRAVDPVSRTVLARLQPTDPKVTLTPGQAVQVDLFPGQARDAVSIPNDAVLRYPDGSRVVWVLREVQGQSVARRQRVELGNTADENVLVLDGLGTSDRVVVRGNEGLQDEQPVQARAFQPRAAARGETAQPADRAP